MPTDILRSVNKTEGIRSRRPAARRAWALLAAAWLIALPAAAQVTPVGPTPANLAFAMEGYHYPSGKVQSLTIGVDGILYVSTAYSGVWVSKDGGKEWQQSTRPDPGYGDYPSVSACQPGKPGALCSPSVSHVAASPVFPGLVFASTYADTRVNPRNGIYRSTDEGSTWTLVHKFNCTEMNGAAGQVVFAPDDPKLVFAAGGCGVAFSENHGITWKEVALPTGATESWRIAVAPAVGSVRRVWTVGETGMFYSADGGLTWFQDKGQMPLASLGYPAQGFGVSSAALVVEPGHPDRVFLGSFRGAGDTPQLFYSRFKIVDGAPCLPTADCIGFIGSLWAGDYSAFKTDDPNQQQAAWASLPSPPAYGDAGQSSGSGNIYVHVKATSADRYLLFFSDRNGVHVSEGRPTSYASWHRFDGKPACLTYTKTPPNQDEYYVHPDPHAIALSSDFDLTFTTPSDYKDPYRCTLAASYTGTAWLGHDGGVSYSTNGTTWPLSAGLHTLEIQAGLAGLAPPGATAPALYFGVPDDDNFYTLDGGKTWKDPETACGDCSPWFADPAIPNRVLEIGRSEGWYIFRGDSTHPPAVLASARLVPGPTSTSSDGKSVYDNRIVHYGSESQRGYRPIVQTLASEDAPQDLDFVMIARAPKYDAQGNPLPDVLREVLRARQLSTVTSGNEWWQASSTLSDGSKVWRIGPPLSDNADTANVHVVQASGGHSETVYYVSDPGFSNRLWKWKAGDAEWRQIVPGGTPGSQASFAYRFFVNPYNSSRIYVLDDDGVKRSDDGGVSWEVDESLDALATDGGEFSVKDGYFGNYHTHFVINDMVFVRENPDMAFAVGNAGVFYTRDGTNWIRLLSAVTMPMSPSSVFYDPNTEAPKKFLYVGTLGRSILKIALPDDDTPPVTIATLDPLAPNGNDGWYRSNVTVTLHSTDLQPDNSPGTGVAGTWVRRLIGDIQTALVRYTAPLEITTESGGYTIAYHSQDRIGNVEERQTLVLKIDKTAPRTTANTTGGGEWATGAVTVSLAASDLTSTGGAGSGVSNTRYRVNGGSWETYSGPFVVSQAGDNLVQFHSMDVAGNREDLQSLHVRVDGTPPQTTLFTQPAAHSRFEGWFRTPVELTLEAVDPAFPSGEAGSGVANTEYQLVSREWVPYTTPITLDAETEGMIFTYRSVDAAGNEEVPNSFTIRIDQTAPVTTMKSMPSVGSSGWFTQGVNIGFSAADPPLASGGASSGLLSTRYRVAPSTEWSPYTGGAFDIVGETPGTLVEFQSVDQARNTEDVRGFVVRIDQHPPLVGLTGGTLDTGTWDLAHLARGVLANSGTLELTGAARDNYCVASITLLDGNGVEVGSQAGTGSNTLAYSFTLALRPGVNTARFVVRDCAGLTSMGTTTINVVYVAAALSQPEGAGFWAKAVDTGTYGVSQLTDLLGLVNVASEVFGPDTLYGPVSISNYQGILSVRRDADARARQRAELLATWLNLVSGRLPAQTAVDLRRIKDWQVVVDNTGGSPATTVLNVCTEVEQLNQAGTATAAAYGIAKEVLEAINSGRIWR